MSSKQVPVMTSLLGCDHPPSWSPHPHEWTHLQYRVPGVANAPQMSLQQGGGGIQASHPSSSLLPADMMASIDIMTTVTPRTLFQCGACGSLYWDSQTLVDHLQTQHGCHFACLHCIGRTFDRKLRIPTATKLFEHFRRCHQNVPESHVMDFVDIRTDRHRAGCKCGQCELETMRAQLIELGVGRQSPPVGGSPISWRPTGPVRPRIAPPSRPPPERPQLVKPGQHPNPPVPRPNQVCSNSHPSQQWQRGLAATSRTWKFGPVGPAASEVKQFLNPSDGKDATCQELHNLDAFAGQRDNLNHDSRTKEIHFLQMKLVQKDYELRLKDADLNSAIECSRAAIAFLHKDRIAEKHTRKVEGLLDQEVRLLRKRPAGGGPSKQVEIDQTRAELKKAWLEKRAERSNLCHLLKDLFVKSGQNQTNAGEGPGDAKKMRRE